MCHLCRVGYDFGRQDIVITVSPDLMAKTEIMVTLVQQGPPEPLMGAYMAAAARLAQVAKGAV